MNRLITIVIFSILTLFSCSNTTEEAENVETISSETIIEALKIENLLRDSLALTEGVEVVVSYLEMPKETTLPTHYHPGEEFVYMIEGSGELSLKDQSKLIIKTGDVVKVPLKQVHSFSTIDESAYTSA